MTELEIQIDLDEEGRTMMYEKLCDEFGEETVNQMLEQQVIQQVTDLFDNREQIKRQLEQ